MSMTPEAKKAAAAYLKEWRRRNRDKVKAYNALYWQRKAESRRDTAPEGDKDDKR